MPRQYVEKNILCVAPAGTQDARGAWEEGPEIEVQKAGRGAAWNPKWNLSSHMRDLSSGEQSPDIYCKINLNYQPGRGRLRTQAQAVWLLNLRIIRLAS